MSTARGGALATQRSWSRWFPGARGLEPVELTFTLSSQSRPPRVAAAFSSPDGASSPRTSAAAHGRRLAESPRGRRPDIRGRVLDQVPQHVFTLPARAQHLLARPRRLVQEAASKACSASRAQTHAAREPELLVDERGIMISGRQPSSSQRVRKLRDSRESDAHERPEAIG
jgi:hypothetical protein